MARGVNPGLLKAGCSTGGAVSALGGGRGGGVVSGGDGVDEAALCLIRPAVLALRSGMLNRLPRVGVAWGEGGTTPVGFCGCLPRVEPILSSPGVRLTAVPRKLGSG